MSRSSALCTRGAVVGVDGGGVAAEADQQLAAVGQEPVGHEVAEGMPWAIALMPRASPLTLNQSFIPRDA